MEYLTFTIYFADVSIQNYAITLLRCCGELMPDQLPHIRVDLAHKIWNLLKEQGMLISSLDPYSLIKKLVSIVKFSRTRLQKMLSRITLALNLLIDSSNKTL